MKKKIIRSAVGAMRETGKRTIKKLGLKHTGQFKKIKKVQGLPNNQIFKYDIDIQVDTKNLKRYAKRVGKKTWKKAGREITYSTAGGLIAGTAIYQATKKRSHHGKKKKKK